MKLIFFIFALYSPMSLSYEIYLHRSQEVLSTQEITWSEKCSAASTGEIENLFDLSKIDYDEIKGLEVDIYYPQNLGELIIYHKSKKSFKPESEFQCFGGYYIRLSDFISFAKSKNKNIKFWLDLKNDNWSGIYSALQDLEKSSYQDDFIIEMDNIFGNLIAQKNNLQSSFWVKFDDNSLVNKARFFIYDLMGFKRFSSHCKKIKKNYEFLDKASSLLCWGKHQDLEGLSKLEVVLSSSH